PMKIIQQIHEETSMERHRQKMEKVQKGEAPVESQFNGIREVRWDAANLITDRHIQSGKSNRWKEELDQAQQSKVNEVFGGFIEQFL
ncbi:MAG: hypothetical protein HQL53_02940, partial [Magnetococcales bacterium]|nr:hypothetical protein [Magnetococcales bacterium]